MLKESFEKCVFLSLFKQKPVSSFTDVFPAEPVIAIVLKFNDFLKTLFISFSKCSGFLLNIIFEFFDFLFETAKVAPFLIASQAKLFPSTFFPLTPKKIEFFLISFELNETDLKNFFLSII